MQDTASDRIGIVVNVDGLLVRLRPGGGGPTWTTSLTAVYPASPMDELRARVADINAWRSMGSGLL